MNERARILSQWIDYLDRLAFPYQSPPNPADLMRNTEEMERLLQEILDVLRELKTNLPKQPEEPSKSGNLPAPLPAELPATPDPE